MIAGAAAIVSLRVTSKSAMAGSCHSAGAVRARADDPAAGCRHGLDAHAVAPLGNAPPVDPRGAAPPRDDLHAPAVDEDAGLPQAAAARRAQADGEAVPAAAAPARGGRRPAAGGGRG